MLVRELNIKCPAATCICRLINQTENFAYNLSTVLSCARGVSCCRGTKGISRIAEDEKEKYTRGKPPDLVK